MAPPFGRGFARGGPRTVIAAASESGAGSSGANSRGFGIAGGFPPPPSPPPPDPFVRMNDHTALVEAAVSLNNAANAFRIQFGPLAEPADTVNIGWATAADPGHTIADLTIAELDGVDLHGGGSPPSTSRTTGAFSTSIRYLDEYVQSNLVNDLPPNYEFQWESRTNIGSVLGGAFNPPIGAWTPIGAATVFAMRTLWQEVLPGSDGTIIAVARIRNPALVVVGTSTITYRIVKP